MPADSPKYVRIKIGEYKGRYGIVDYYTGRTMLSVALTPPHRVWDGILLDENEIEYISRKEYFKARLHGC